MVRRDSRVGKELVPMNPTCPNCREYCLDMVCDGVSWVWKCKFCKSVFEVV